MFNSFSDRLLEFVSEAGFVITENIKNMNFLVSIGFVDSVCKF